MKKPDQLSIVHASYVRGADTPRKVEKATGVPHASAADCLCWIRKADGDLERARRLRNDYSAQLQKQRYHTDPVYRARALASAKAWYRRRRDAEVSNTEAVK